MYMECRCPIHNKPLYGNGQTSTHLLFKCPDCDYAGDGPRAVRHDLPERFIALEEEVLEVLRENRGLRKANLSLAPNQIKLSAMNKNLKEEYQKLVEENKSLKEENEYLHDIIEA